jgi:hypothetical protein
MPIARKRGRKLLVASLGVAAVSYVGCSSSNNTTVGSGKDAASDALNPTRDAGHFVGNLMAAPSDAGHDAGASSKDAAKDTGIAMMGVGNLMIAPSDASPE